uniref:AlNc14C261G9818 protein n=1 Tax=Albugo laibachii Nc14 TaxID=890382 RepID=F0WTZ5_9STRA|nr:AlNc14C261G9818 [Albugo laibachii Nc14]|eukprot:CCA24839.1 AlNc14C261G9818 [Albugo laibachii Nc14]
MDSFALCRLAWTHQCATAIDRGRAHKFESLHLSRNVSASHGFTTSQPSNGTLVVGGRGFASTYW